MSFDFAADFRETLGFVTDQPGAVAWLGEAYPTVKGGNTAGWSASLAGNCRDRSNAVDGRLAGINFATAAGTEFRVDLPGPGAYVIHLAAGDPLTSGSVGNWDFYDGATLLFSVAAPGTGFTDATGATYSAADWPLNESGRPVTISGTSLRVVSHDSSVNCIAHLRVVQSGGGGTTVSGSGYSAGPSSAASVGLLRAAAPASAVGRGSAASLGAIRLTGSGLSHGLSSAVGRPVLLSTGTGSASGRGFGAGVLPGGVTVVASGCATGRGSAASLGGLTILAPGGSVGRSGGVAVGLFGVSAGGSAVSISVVAGVVPGPLGPGTRAGVWVVPGLARTWVVPAGGRTWEVPSQ